MDRVCQMCFDKLKGDTSQLTSFTCYQWLIGEQKSSTFNSKDNSGRRRQTFTRTARRTAKVLKPAVLEVRLIIVKKAFNMLVFLFR